MTIETTEQWCLCRRQILVSLQFCIQRKQLVYSVPGGFPSKFAASILPHNKFNLGCQDFFFHSYLEAKKIVTSVFHISPWYICVTVTVLSKFPFSRIQITKQDLRLHYAKSQDTEVTVFILMLNLICFYKTAQLNSDWDIRLKIQVGRKGHPG